MDLKRLREGNSGGLWQREENDLGMMIVRKKRKCPRPANTFFKRLRNESVSYDFIEARSVTDW